MTTNEQPHRDIVMPPRDTVDPGAAWRSTNGLASWSLALALLWGFGVLSIVAIFFGHMALDQIKQRGQDGRQVAIVGLIFGYLGIVPAAILAVMFFIAVALSS